MLILEDDESYEKFDLFLKERRSGGKLSIDGILDRKSVV